MTGIRFKGLLVLALEMFLFSGVFAATPAAGAVHAYWLDFAGQRVQLQAAHETVGGILAENYIRVAAGDEVDPPLTRAVSPGTLIHFRPGSHVVIREGNYSWTVDAPVTTVADALANSGVALTAGTTVQPDLGAAVTPGLQIFVDHAGLARRHPAAPTAPAVSGYALDLSTGRTSVGVLFDDGGFPRYRRVIAANVAEALLAAGITLAREDRVEPALDTPVSGTLRVVITRVNHHIVTVDVDVPYATRDVSNPDILRGTDSVLEPGAVGLDEVIQEVVFENGVEIGRHEIGRHRLRNPSDRVVSVGTKLPRNALPANPDYFFSDVYRMYATAYSAPGGRTASGRPARYGAVAIDPSVIPMGTHLYVEGYGFAWAADTGSAIKGMRIDLCFDTYRESVDYGVAHVRVWVLTN